MSLSLRGLTISLPAAPLVQPFDLDIPDGEIVTLMGASGVGKSSLLAFIAGDLPPPLQGSGLIHIDGEDVSILAPERRRIGRLFQDDLLFPHLTVAENLLFGMARGPQAQRLARMQEALAAAGLEGFVDRPPHTLSGGQRARVSVLRSLLAEPRAMLLDEPFNKLDMALRRAFRDFVFEQLLARATPTLMVTHDRSDAPPGGRVLAIGVDGTVRDD